MWPTLAPSVPYSFDNINAAQSVPRAAVNIISLDSDQQTMGPRAKIFREGLVEVRLYGEKNVGRRQLDELCDHVKTVFERRKLGRVGGASVFGRTNRVITHTASVNELRRDRDSGELWIVSVTIPFEYVEVSVR